MNGTEITIPHLTQYFGVWSMASEPFLAAIERVNGMELLAHVEQAEIAARSQGIAAGPRKGYELIGNGIAVVEIIGAMTKYGSSLSEYAGSVQLRRTLRAMMADDGVRAIVLKIDSPGGTVAGTGDLADEVWRINQIKPITAYIEDTGTSAAYEVASQAGRVVANRDALVGSIGTYGVLYDYSQMFKEAGVKAYVIRAGEFKGAGTVGTKITDEQLAEFARTIEQINKQFIGRVARGRGLPDEQVQTLADGRVHVGEYAIDLKLIDAVETFDAAVSQLEQTNQINRSPVRMAGAHFQNEDTDMSTQDAKAAASSTSAATETKPVASETKPAGANPPLPATFAELKTTLPEATAEFREQCLEQNLTLVQAKDRWTAKLVEDLKAMQAERDALKTAKPGVEALGSRDSAASAESGDPIERFNQAVAEKTKQGIDKAKAIRQVVKADPDLHAVYLAAWNEQHRND